MPWPRKQEIAIYLSKKRKVGEKRAKNYMRRHGAQSFRKSRRDRS